MEDPEVSQVIVSFFLINGQGKGGWRILRSPRSFSKRLTACYLVYVYLVGYAKYSAGLPGQFLIVFLEQIVRGRRDGGS